MHFCSFWPARSVELYEGNFNSSDLANKILVIGNTVMFHSGCVIDDANLDAQYDPLTPFEFAQSVVDDYGDQARLLRFDAFGVS